MYQGEGPLQTAASNPHRTTFPAAAGRCSLLLALLLLPVADGAQDFSQPTQKPAPETALVQQANAALAAGDYPAALKLLMALNARTPKNAEVLYNLGLTTEALPAVTEPSAESWYRQALVANPLFPLPYVALGLLLARTGDAPEAHVLLAAVSTLSDATPALKARAARTLARLDETARPALASAELLAALALTPETPDDILLAAEIAEAAHDLPAAEQAYRRFLALTPGDPAATAALAHVLLAEHHPADAEALLTAALAAPADQKDPTLTAQLAAAYLASGDPDKIALAAPLLEGLHTAQAADANVTRLLARVYLETGHPDQADPLYAALIEAQSQNGSKPDPTLLDNRAEALMRLHQPGAAETLLKQAVADPAAFPTPAAFGDAATRLAFAAAEIDDPRTTLQALTLRATVLPPSPTALFLEATANDTLHQSRKAADLYQQFLAAANGGFPQQEAQARQRLALLGHRK